MSLRFHLFCRRSTGYFVTEAGFVVPKSSFGTSISVQN